MLAKKFAPVVAAVLALVLVGGCSSSDGDATGDAKPKDPLAGVTWTDKTGTDTLVVDAKDNTFSPQYVTVTAGTKVTFDNRGRNPHNVIAVEKGAFKTVEVPDFQPGDTADRTFDKPGDYAYYCSLHGTTTAGMIGGIRVVE